MSWVFFLVAAPMDDYLRLATMLAVMSILFSNNVPNFGPGRKADKWPQNKDMMVVKILSSERRQARFLIYNQQETYRFVYQVKCSLLCL
jgi:hypothetical protein